MIFYNIRFPADGFFLSLRERYMQTNCYIVDIIDYVNLRLFISFQ